METAEDSSTQMNDIIWEYQVVEDKRTVEYGSGDEKLSGEGEIYNQTLMDWLKDLNEHFGLQIAITRDEVSGKVVLEVGFEQEVNEDIYNAVVKTPHTPNYEDLETMINSGVYWFKESNIERIEKIFLG